VKLLDVPLADGPPAPEAPPDDRALDLLREAACLALEGRPAGVRPTLVSIPLPRYAVGPLDRLLGTGGGYARVADFRADLAAVRDRPAEIGRSKRLAYAAIQTGLLLLGFVLMVLLALYMDRLGWGYAFLVGPVVGVALAFFTRDGLSELLGGVALVRSDGRPPGRWQVAWRALLIWATVSGVFFAFWFGTQWLARVFGSPFGKGLDHMWAAFVAVMVWQFLTVWVPPRALGDLLAGTRLVPR
jgi:hypothetical protein